MEVKVNGETLKLELTFSGIDDILKREYAAMPFDKAAFDRKAIAAVYRLSAVPESGRNIIKCYGIVTNEAVIEERYGSLDSYVDYLYEEANADKAFADARIDEMRALNTLVLLSDQYRTTSEDPEFMSGKPDESVSCIIHIDAFIIEKDERHKGYAKAIWANMPSLFAEYGIAVRYMTTIVYPMNLDNEEFWRPFSPNYDKMYRTMAGIIESQGFVPCTYSELRWPSAVHIRQFNKRLPVSEENKWRYDSDDLYAQIMGNQKK